jgi:hypothetical protein
MQFRHIFDTVSTTFAHMDPIRYPPYDHVSVGSYPHHHRCLAPIRKRVLDGTVWRHSYANLSVDFAASNLCQSVQMNHLESRSEYTFMHEQCFKFWACKNEYAEAASAAAAAAAAATLAPQQPNANTGSGSCADGVLNGIETDVDCGGGACRG